MATRIRSFLLLTAWLVVPAVVSAQVPSAPAPTATRPATLSPPPRPAGSTPPPPGQVPGSLDARPGATRLPEHGPSRPLAPVLPQAPVRVQGADGLPLHGWRQAGPGRVFDPRTGRYYDAVPAGDGQLRLRPSPRPVPPPVPAVKPTP